MARQPDICFPIKDRRLHCRATLLEVGTGAAALLDQPERILSSADRASPAPSRARDASCGSVPLTESLMPSALSVCRPGLRIRRLGEKFPSPTARPARHYVCEGRRNEAR
jgi:hypothetical protein